MFEIQYNDINIFRCSHCPFHRGYNEYILSHFWFYANMSRCDVLYLHYKWAQSNFTVSSQSKIYQVESGTKTIAVV